MLNFHKIRRGEETVVEKPTQFVVFDPVVNENWHVQRPDLKSEISDWAKNTAKTQLKKFKNNKRYKGVYKQEIVILPSKPRKPAFDILEDIPDTLYNDKKPQEGRRQEQIRVQNNEFLEGKMKELKQGVINRNIKDSLVDDVNFYNSALTTILNAVRQTDFFKEELFKDSVGVFRNILLSKYTQGELIAFSRNIAGIRLLISKYTKNYKPKLVANSKNKYIELISEQTGLEPKVVEESANDPESQISYQIDRMVKAQAISLSEIESKGTLLEGLADEFSQLLSPLFVQSVFQSKNGTADYQTPDLKTQFIRSERDALMFFQPKEPDTTPLEPKYVPPYKNTELPNEDKIPEGAVPNLTDYYGETEEEEKGGAPLRGQEDRSFVKGKNTFVLEKFRYNTKSVRDYTNLFDYAERNSSSTTPTSVSLDRMVRFGKIINYIHSLQGRIEPKDIQAMNISNLKVLWRYMLCKATEIGIDFVKKFFSPKWFPESVSKEFLIKNILKGMNIEAEDGNVYPVERLEGRNPQGFGIKKLLPKKKNTLTAKEKKALKKAGNDSL